MEVWIEGVGRTESAATEGCSRRQRVMKLRKEIEAALTESVRCGKEMDKMVDSLIASREEAEKDIRDHVALLHSPLDQHHHRQQEVLRQQYKDFLHQILVNKMEWLNYEARLVDLLKEVTEKIEHVTEDCDVTAVSTDDVTALSNQLASYKARAPTLEMPELTRELEVPEATADDLQTLVGRFVFTENKNCPPPSQQGVASSADDATTSSRPSGPTTTTSATTTNSSSSAKPSAGSTAPKASDNSTAPRLSASSKTPKASDNSTTPKASDNSTTPKASDNSTTPKASDNSTTPKASASSTIPKASASSTIPKASDNSTTPKASDNSTIPKASDKSTTPKASDNRTTPKASASSSTPKASDNSTIPKASDKSTTPKASDNRTTPKASASSSTPKASDNSTIPKASDNSTTPKASASSTRPKALDNSTTPKASASSTTPKASDTSTLKPPDSGTTSASPAQRIATGDTASLSPSAPGDLSGSKAANENLKSSTPPGPNEQATAESAPGPATQNANKKKRKRRKKNKKKKALQQESFAQTPPKPTAIVASVKYPPIAVWPDGEKPAPTAIAPKADGTAWLVYWHNSPNLDLVHEKGDVLQSTEIGGNAVHVDLLETGEVVVASVSPRNLRIFNEDGTKERVLSELNFRCTGVAVGSTGIAFSGSKAIFWIALTGEGSAVVLSKSSDLHNVCSLAVATAQGKELVCAADKGAKAVHFYQKTTAPRGEFAPLPPFRLAPWGDVEAAAAFTPVSVSAHRSGFLAVLDAASRSVFVVDVEKNLVVSVIDGEWVCGGGPGGVPAVLAFVPIDEEEEPELWVVSTAGRVCMACLTFLYG